MIIPEPPRNTLSAHNISKSYGAVRALADVTLEIPPGQAVAIMGPSGSGKSTLLHCLSGILVPDAGEVSLGGDSVSALRDKQRSLLRRRRFGFVFQDGQLLPELPARENVALPLLLTGIPRTQALQAADVWLGKLGLAGMENRRPGELSGGQAQRVAIARALIHKPEVVFADEPTGALDQATGHEVMQLLTATTARSGASLVVVTHDDEVARWCERLIEIRDAMVHDDQQISRTIR
ncbi:ABC transporter ATP-binding protein [Cryobacterium algoricola]|uniref:ABC transporter ATP-binding protein n=2 Tax=Cryobacterium TaxID=69578 RepID=A0AA41UIG4_9MICO|nr:MULTISPECIES: ABC transporter ATP-binding protein [Cryobacterium]MCI4659484.1 ABC transporter ATP-binding protein [Cryobacterium zhongshanensis]TFB84127.1 ABC transporter ATP-binding protein [Cryobacterium algoricola]